MARSNSPGFPTRWKGGERRRSASSVAPSSTCIGSGRHHATNSPSCCGLCDGVAVRFRRTGPAGQRQVLDDHEPGRAGRPRVGGTAEPGHPAAGGEAAQAPDPALLDRLGRLSRHVGHRRQGESGVHEPVRGRISGPGGSPERDLRGRQSTQSGQHPDQPERLPTRRRQPRGQLEPGRRGPLREPDPPEELREAHPGPRRIPSLLDHRRRHLGRLRLDRRGLPADPGVRPGLPHRRARHQHDLRRGRLRDGGVPLGRRRRVVELHGQLRRHLRLWRG